MEIDKDTRLCRFCGKAFLGPSCAFAPDSIHQSSGNNDECIWCGSTSYGPVCVWRQEHLRRSNKKGKPVHEHGHGKSIKDGKSHCIFCGRTDVGPGCPFSDDGKHHH